MKIYFAGSIRSGRDEVPIYGEIISILAGFGQVLTEHIGDINISVNGELDIDDTQIYLRDIEWITECNIVVAEVTNPSLGVGFEIGVAQGLGKPILCLYRDIEGRKISAMLSGNPEIILKKYQIETLKYDLNKVLLIGLIDERR